MDPYAQQQTPSLPGMQAQGGQPVDDQFYEYLATLPEEQLLAMFQPFDAQQGALQQQMAQAQALRKPSGVQHSTGLGAAMGGLGDVIRAAGGTQQLRDLRREEQGMLKGQQSEAATRAGNYAKFLRQGRQGAPAKSVDVMLPPEFFAQR